MSGSNMDRSSGLKPTTTITLTVRKFDGDYVEGMAPAEEVVRTVVVPADELLAAISQQEEGDAS